MSWVQRQCIFGMCSDILNHRLRRFIHVYSIWFRRWLVTGGEVVGKWSHPIGKLGIMLGIISIAAEVPLCMNVSMLSWNLCWISGRCARNDPFPKETLFRGKQPNEVLHFSLLLSFLYFFSFFLLSRHPLLAKNPRPLAILTPYGNRWLREIIVIVSGVIDWIVQIGRKCTKDERWRSPRTVSCSLFSFGFEKCSYSEKFCLILNKRKAEFWLDPRFSGIYADLTS